VQPDDYVRLGSQLAQQYGRKAVFMNQNQHTLIKYWPSEVRLDLPGRIDERTLAQRQLTLRDLWRVTSRRRYIIFGTVAIIVALAAAYAFLKTPMYEGVARLHIDPTRSTNLGLDDQGDRTTALDLDGRIKTEITIIQSDTVAMQVMKALQLYANPRFAGKDTINTPVGEMSDLSPSQRRKLLDRFKSDLSVKAIPATQIVEIRFRSWDPALSAVVANSVIDEYLQRTLSARVEGTAQVSEWVSKQMQDVRETTTTAQEKLAEFQKANNMLGTDESDNIVTDRLKQLNEELTQAEADRIVKEGRYRLGMSGNAELVGELAPSTTLQVLRTQEAELQAQYAQLRSKFGSGYPKLRELQDQLAHVETAIAAEDSNIKTRLTNEYQAADKAESMIRAQFEEQKAEAYRLNEHVAQYAILKHEVEAGQQLYDTLQLKLKAAGITSGLASSFVDVVDRAQIPDLPVGPRKSLYLALGIGGGLLGGLLLGLIRDSLDDTVGTSEELESITALPELASVPYLPALGENHRERAKSARPLLAVHSVFSPITLREPRSPGVEAYRTLCSVLLSAQEVRKTVVVTSAVSNEGKSTVSCNLATALAQRGRKVLLVDADLRCSSMDLGARPGLSTMCAAGAANHPKYQPLSDLPGLHVIPAGIQQTDPTGVLDSTRMMELMTAWRAEYDHIIIDTPPALLFADALVLAAQGDAVILVARCGMSNTKALLRARNVLARSGANILGFVLNAVRGRDYYYEYSKGCKHLSIKSNLELVQ
jgi:capsular exopolysaccharide synthesis family protein